MIEVEIDDFGVFLGSLVAIVVGLWLILWLLCIGMYLSAGWNAWQRCYSRGYESSEVVVNYPRFWHADTVCYKGDKLEGGTKL